jgi:hypothetical protein
MTAEVAVMNAQAVALAADSAVSIRATSKTFTSADKIFGVSAWEPVGAMIHGNAEFMGVPWETIIKEYRRQLGRGRFATIHEYAEDFAQFVASDKPQYFPKEVRQKQARIEIRTRLEDILDVIETSMGVCIEKHGAVREGHLPIFAEGAIKGYRKRWSGAPLIHGLSPRRAAAIEKAFAKDSRLVQKEVFMDLPMTDQTRAELSELCGWFLTRMLPREEVLHSSGVVFAGFGTKQHFPHIVEYVFHGIVGSRLRYEHRSSTEISRSHQSDIVAFGQRDMVQAFLDGIDPDFKDEITRSLRTFIVGYSDAILNAIPSVGAEQRDDLKERFARIGNDAFDRYRASLKEWRIRAYRSKTLAVIGALPKDELAGVAESLVSLTSLKRRVSLDASVSPPVDVCVISKHDGFVWVKKKHYFPSDLNQRFNQRFNLRSAELAARGDENERRDSLPISTGDSNPILRHEGAKPARRRSAGAHRRGDTSLGPRRDKRR